MGRFTEYINEKYTALAIAGSGAIGVASAAACGVLIGGASPLLGIGVAAVTGVGALLLRPRSEEEIDVLLKREPRTMIELTGGEKAPDAKTQVGGQRYLISMMDKVLAIRSNLGEDVVNAVTPVFENLAEILKKWNTYTGIAEAEFTIEAILYDYLPTTLETYINIPKTDDVEAMSKLKADLISQLNTLTAETKKIRNNYFQNQVRSFDAQGNFLKEKFGAIDDNLILDAPADKEELALEAPVTHKKNALKI